MSELDGDKPDLRLIKSYVWSRDRSQCYFISTIERTYDRYDGPYRGDETIAWEYDWDSSERGGIIWQGGGIMDHLWFCRVMHVLGEIPDEDNETHERMRYE